MYKRQVIDGVLGSYFLIRWVLSFLYKNGLPVPVYLVILRSHIHLLGAVTGMRCVIPFPAVGKPVYMMKVP